MQIFQNIQAIIFDYGGTLDTGGCHWSDVLWSGYVHSKVPVEESSFRDAYVFSERYLGKFPIIKPEDSFRTVLNRKITIQLSYLSEKGYLSANASVSSLLKDISDYCYSYTFKHISASRAVLEKLSRRLPLALVTNFYGNINAVLKEFSLEKYFAIVVESVSVGVRKPDPKIFFIACQKLKIDPENVLVVGDSIENDVLPARSLGCKAILLRRKDSTH